MNITETNTVMSGSENAIASSNQALGRDDFLNLLVEQLKNQDPMNPMESAEFAAQLAQFSSLEQLTNVNDSMKLLIDQETTTGNAQAVSYIGKQVKATGNTTLFTEEAKDGCLFELEGAATQGYLYISDTYGNLVRSQELGSDDLTAGEHFYNWDGTNNSGKDVEPGVYNFEVVATNPEGIEVPTKTFISTEVTGINLSGDSASLMAGEMEIPLTSVIQVEEIKDGNDKETNG
jgi:flagellar basal-body rod modification protein FlgD